VLEAILIVIVLVLVAAGLYAAFRPDRFRMERKRVAESGEGQ